MPRLSILIARGEVCPCLRSKQMSYESPVPDPEELDDRRLPNGPFWCVETQSLIGSDGRLVGIDSCRPGRGCCRC